MTDTRRPLHLPRSWVILTCPNCNWGLRLYGKDPLISEHMVDACYAAHNDECGDNQQTLNV